ncbi:hypothetical protein [Actinoplanes siamensis]|nr:hypothetical protein [Actinoplanes siamensis]
MRFALVDHVRVAQTFAADADELVEKVRARSLSPLAGLSDRAFREGLSALRRDARAGYIAGPIVDRLDLVVFRAPSGSSGGAGRHPLGRTSPASGAA